MDFITGLAAPVGALGATWAIAHKLGGFLRARKVAGQALEWVSYARRNLVALNDLVFEVERGMRDDKITPAELKVLIEKLANLARELRRRTVLEEAETALIGMAPKK